MVFKLLLLSFVGGLTSKETSGLNNLSYYLGSSFLPWADYFRTLDVFPSFYMLENWLVILL